MQIPETRNPRGTPQPGALLEREHELSTIDGLLESLEEGDRAILIQGQPGLGKTRLWEAALDRASARELLVVRAVGSELERDFAFGVAGQLLHSLLASLPAREREALLREAPARIRALYRDGPRLNPAEGQEGLAVSHGLFTVVAAAAETRPTLVAIDDVHWADAPSLEFVLYLLHRSSELPVVLLLTTRPAEADTVGIDAVAGHPAVRVLTLTPLGPGSVAEVVARELGDDHDEALRKACLDATGGNPFYLHELLHALSEEVGAGVGRDTLAERARALVPAAVARTLRSRIARLGADATGVARAVAILGEDVALRNAASLADLAVGQAAVAADALAAADVLRAGEPLRFVHALVRAAVEQDVPAFERAGRHLEAARLLAAEGEPAERVAAHLLRGRAEGDPWAVQQLREAAAQASAQGAASSAVRYLERALAEPPPPESRGDVLAELGVAEAELGLDAAEGHLALAAAAIDDPRRRAEIALARGGALHARGLAEPAALAFRDGLAELDAAQGELRDRLQAGFLLSASVVPTLQPEAVRMSAEVMADGRDESASRRLVLSQTMVDAAFGARPAAVVVDLANRAWDDGRLLGEASTFGAAWIMVAGAFCLAGDLERSLEMADAAAAHARERSAPLTFATATFMRALPELWQGDVDGALADLELARDARRYGWRQYVRSAAAELCVCLIEKGDLDGAAAAIDEEPPLVPPYDAEDAVRLFALAELRRAQGSYAEAYETAVTAGATAEASFVYLGYCPWRSSAAQSALALGRLDDAREHVRRELERTETTQVLHERIRALRLAALLEEGETGLSLLREAVALGEAGPPRIETIHALVALGSGLRRARKRAEARPLLERAYELSRRGGATALQELAAAQLAAVGARPRRDAFSGPESLTPSEKRVAELAAAGCNNREIAQLLFVTPKTVEFHLRNTYRKLGIETRRELADALAA